MGYALLLDLAFASDPEWSPLVFVYRQECEAFARAFYARPQTIEGWSVEKVPDPGKWRFASGELSIVS